MLRNISLIILFFSVRIFSQISGVWQNYTDMKNLSDIAITGNGIWAASDGGAFFFQTSDSSYLKFTKSEGLSGHDIRSIEVDNSGKIWMGASDGTINVYNPKDNSIKKILDIAQTSNPQKAINDIYYSAEYGGVIVSTDFGISLINPDNFTFTETVKKFGDFPTETKVFSVTTGNSIYVSTPDGVAVLKSGAVNISAPESWITYPTINEFAAGEVYKTVFFENQLFSATDKGLFYYDGSLWRVAAHSGFSINDFFISGDSLVLALSNSIHSFKNGADILIYSHSGYTFKKIIESEGIFYIAANKGVEIFTNGETQNIFPNSPEANLFNSLAVDNSGRVWVASGKDPNGKGIYMLANGIWTNYNKSNVSQFTSDFFHVAAAEKDGNVYFSNWGGGFSVFDGGEFHTYNASNTDLIGVSANPNYVVITGTVVDSKGTIWSLNSETTGRKALSALTPDSVWYFFKFDNPFIQSEKVVFHLAVDQYDTKWFTVKGEGVYYFNENGTLGDVSDDIAGKLTTSNGLGSNEINSITIDNRGEVWIGTSLGVNYIPNPAQPNSGISSVFSLRQQSINSIAVDPLNRKWVSTTAGVSVISPDGTVLLAQYDVNNSPLPTNFVHSIAVDQKKGIVYFGTDFGLSSLTTSAIKPADNFGDLFAYPNPFLIGNGNSQLTIDGLIRNSTLKIFSISGNLIREIETIGGRVGYWDGRDENGGYVKSGIYIIIAFDAEADNVASAKVAVIRK